MKINKYAFALLFIFTILLKTTREDGKLADNNTPNNYSGNDPDQSNSEEESNEESNTSEFSEYSEGSPERSEQSPESSEETSIVSSEEEHHSEQPSPISEEESSVSSSEEEEDPIINKYKCQDLTKEKLEIGKEVYICIYIKELNKKVPFKVKVDKYSTLTIAGAYQLAAKAEAEINEGKSPQKKQNFSLNFIAQISDKLTKYPSVSFY